MTPRASTQRARVIGSDSFSFHPSFSFSLFFFNLFQSFCVTNKYKCEHTYIPVLNISYKKLFLVSFMDGARSGIVFCVHSVPAQFLFLSHRFLLCGAFPVFPCAVPGEGGAERAASSGFWVCLLGGETHRALCSFAPSRRVYEGDACAVCELGSIPLLPRGRGV